MLQATGRIAVVQEGRFLLEDDSGGHRLLIASHALGLNPEDLRALARGRRHVTVRYREPEHSAKRLNLPMQPRTRLHMRFAAASSR
jgi:hypothetical protein